MQFFCLRDEKTRFTRTPNFFLHFSMKNSRIPVDLDKHYRQYAVSDVYGLLSKFDDYPVTSRNETVFRMVSQTYVPIPILLSTT